MLRLALLALILSAPTAVADEIDDFVRGEMTKQKIPGLTLAVIQDGKPTKVQGYGLANLEHDVPAKRETVYQTGSVGKQFTAMAVMLLVEDGKIGLDEPVGKYLPDTPESWKGITVRHLLTHTGGVREYTGLIDLTRNYTEDELLKKAYSFKPEFAPGEKWKYSNTGYAVLGILVSKVAGKFYGDVMAERIFQPLGMKTARIISEADIVPNRAAGYRLTFKGELKNQDWVAPRTNTTGDGSLYVTIDDMIKWDAGLAAGKVLKKASYDAMWTKAKTTDGQEHGYGFGWAPGDVNGHKVIGHGGAWQGFTTQINRFVDDKLTVIVLTNLGAPFGRPSRVAAGVEGIVIPGLARKK